MARSFGFDEAIKYCAGVANRHMANGIRSSLHTNPMYDSDDVGKIKDNANVLGPRKLIKILKAKRDSRDTVIAAFLHAK